MTITLPLWLAIPLAVGIVLAWFNVVDRWLDRFIAWWKKPIQQDAAFIPPQERRRQLLSLVESSATRRTGTK